MSELHGQTFGKGSRTVLAVHGITASSAAWTAVADALPSDWRMIAVDLRGRGHSRDLPGPWGLRRHAQDVGNLAAELGPCVLVGHSMGAYVSALVAAERPELFEHVVLVDGAVPLPVPEGIDLDEVLRTTLGPALERLRQTYADVPAYVDFFRTHPALGPYWSDSVEDYVRYDALATSEGVVSRAVDDAVRQDGRDLLALGAELDAALRAAPEGTDLLVAPRGMFDGTPGLLPDAAVAAYAAQVPALRVRTVPGVNHYTILFDPAAAATIAAAVTGSVS